MIYLSYQLINSFFIYALFNSIIVCFFVYTFIYFCVCEQCHSFHNSIFFYKYEIQDFFFMIKTAPLTNIKKCSESTSYMKVEIGNGWIKMLVSPLAHIQTHAHTDARTHIRALSCVISKKRIELDLLENIMSALFMK